MTMTNSWIIRAGILITMLLALCVVATKAGAQHPTNAAATMINVDSFSMWDTSGVGFDLGPLTSGAEPCELVANPMPPLLAFECGSNGYFHFSWSDFVQGSDPSDFTSWTAVYSFFDAEGDKLTITAELAPSGPGAYQTDTLYIMSLDFEGPDVHFDNGVTIDGWRIDFDIADGQVFGMSDWFLSATNDGYWIGDAGGSTIEFSPYFGLSYSQTTEATAAREMIPVPVPEPGFAIAVMSGVAILSVFGRAKREI